MIGLRRSGRISREIPIVLLGTDTSGRVFSEETHTLVLSRHGAGILSRYKLAPDEVLTLRLADSNREAEVRLVGSLGEKQRGYVYGVTFRDPDLDFWQMEFPPPDQNAQPRSTALECAICGSPSLVEQSEVESDVFLVSQSVFRFCDSCGQTTLWKLAMGDVAPPHPKPAPVRLPEPAPPPAPVPDLASAPVAPQRSVYSESRLSDLVSSNFVPLQPAEVPVAVAVQSPPPKPKPSTPPAFSSVGKPNRRRHVRTRVNFTACVRVNLNEEVAECDNVSKGGLCFRSRKLYSENSAIEVAVPYSPGQPAIFVAAQIRRVEELSGLGLFRYGVAYTT